MKAACEAVRATVLARATELLGRTGLHLDGDKIVSATGEVVAGLAEVLADGGVDRCTVLRRVVHHHDLERRLDLRVEGDQHGAVLAGSSCVDDAVSAYLVDLTVPASGTACRLDA